jgi:hypothetical protein
MGGPKKLYTNQKHIYFNNIPRNKNNPYNSYNRSALQSAISTLSHSALKLYLYLGNFKDLPAGIYLSKQDAMNSTKLSERGYFYAINELKEKGYLVIESNDNYIFYESPLTP